MCSKVVNGFQIKSYGHFKFQKSELLGPIEKMARKVFDRKGISTTRKLGEMCKKNIIEKMRFQRQKHEKYLRSKNNVKKSLGAFNQEVRPNSVFLLIRVNYL